MHPFHLHMEEHRTVMRNGKDVTKTPDRGHPDDVARVTWWPWTRTSR